MILQFEHFLFFLLAFLWIVIGSFHVAKYFQKIKLPLITGFLISGVIAGPFFLELVSDESILNLQIVNEFSLSYIAFAAGTELFLKEIRSSLKSILWNTFGQLVITFGVAVVAIILLADHIPFLSGLSQSNVLAIALLTGTIFVARSPSSAIAIINEMRAKGRFTKTAISVTVIKDVLVILLFAICLSIANSLVKGVELSYFFLLELLVELSATFSMGIILARILKFIFSFKIHQHLKVAILLGSGYAVYPFSHYIHHLSENFLPFEILIEPLLVCITVSFIIVNYTSLRIEFQTIVEKIGPAIYAAFFTLAGAMMSLDILADTWKIALLFFIIRLVGMMGGAWLGGTFAGDPKLFRRIGWMPYVTQAGVSLALVMVISNSFPAWGSQLATIIVAVVIVNQLVGPPLFKWAIKRVGENRNQPRDHYEHSRRVLIFGYENQSVALSNELQKNNWKVSIATRKPQDQIEEIPGVKTYHIPGLQAETLANLNLKKFDTFVLLHSDRGNYHIAEWIYENIGEKVVIVRLADRKNLKKFYDLGALVIDPSTAFVNLLQHFVRSPLATSLLMGMEADKDTLDVTVEDESLFGIALRNLRLPVDVLILSVKRKGNIIITHGYTRLRQGDVVTVVGSVESLEKVALQFESFELEKNSTRSAGNN
ncbi:cation:proton antiporter [Mangrovibacterium marinum]|uniref:Transporter (CPA2 family) n=1 Tax=Mangrovibacterium marinum TaxID=1639118 RepID=A0A2T5C5S7_9BACT|nr:cation:proton antiporter [Mangrovibacterium marinum]PTN10259.1 transporter (CPA2 family) [Mangrovibacterium marinum]